MRSKKRERVKQTIAIMRENEVKYNDLVFWAESDKELLLGDEDYVSLKRLQDIEIKYAKDIEYVESNDSWGYGFLFGMLACTKSYKSIILKEEVELPKFKYLDILPQESFANRRKSIRIKEAVRLMYIHDKKYFDLVHYSRMDRKNFKNHIAYRKAVDFVQDKYPRETFELSGEGMNSDRQHGFHSGILAGCRLYSSMVDESIEQALDEFPFLDT